MITGSATAKLFRNLSAEHQQFTRQIFHPNPTRCGFFCHHPTNHWRQCGELRMRHRKIRYGCGNVKMNIFQSRASWKGHLTGKNRHQHNAHAVHVRKTAGMLTTTNLWRHKFWRSSDGMFDAIRRIARRAESESARQRNGMLQEIPAIKLGFHTLRCPIANQCAGAGTPSTLTVAIFGGWKRAKSRKAANSAKLIGIRNSPRKSVTPFSVNTFWMR